MKTTLQKQLALAANIKKSREESGLTQYKVGELLEVDCSLISRIECATTVPSVFRIAELADIFNVSIDRLLDREDKF